MSDRTQPNHEIALSLVVPVFNEADVFDRLVDRLQATMDQAAFRSEAVLVDDGSTDGTRDRIQEICRADARFRGVLLSRNFGHQRAVSAGLDYARGKAVGVLDGDLQDPPELILDFYNKLAEGYGVVYAIRQKRKEGIVKRFCYWAFYRLLRKLAAIEIPLDSGDFCLMSRAVVDQIRNMPERHRFIRGMRSWVGFRQTGIAYDRDQRHAGDSKYTFSKLVLLAIDGLLTFSELPLRLATFAGTTIAGMSILWAFYLLAWRWFATSELPGFATVACGMFFLGGIQLIGMGILGEYIARIHNEVKGRPIYIVEHLFEQADRMPSVQPMQLPATQLPSPTGDAQPVVAPSFNLNPLSPFADERVDQLIDTLQHLDSV